MNQTNSGTVESRIAELEKNLDDYDKKFSLHKIVISPEVEKILELKKEELLVLPRELCFTYGYLLASFSIAVQREYNRQSAKQKWAEHNINIVIGQENDNYGDKYTKFEIKKAMVISGNEYAKALNKIMLTALTQVEELNFLSTRINSMADILKEYGKSKRD